jgi:uncharacterized protein YbdZ (MbtH family)
VVQVLDGPDGTFVVLVNDNGEYSLWPPSFDGPTALVRRILGGH